MERDARNCDNQAIKAQKRVSTTKGTLGITLE